MLVTGVCSRKITTDHSDLKWHIANSFEASLLFRSLELWMNVHLVRRIECLPKVMCEGVSNIVKEGGMNKIVPNSRSISRAYAEISR